MSQRDDKRVRFSLTKRQVEEIEGNLLVDSEGFIAEGIEQPDGVIQFDVALDQLEDLFENLTAAANDADDPKGEARLGTICRKLEQVISQERR